MTAGLAPLDLDLDAAPLTRTVCLLIRAETLAGNDVAFEGLMHELARRVRADERDCLSYVVTRTMGSREAFAVHARFRSWRACDAHAKSAHMERLLPRLTALLAAPVSVEIFVEI